MKKFLTLILAMLYMGTSTGATFHMHYCMEKLVDVSLWHDEETHVCDSSCCKNCCKDVHHTVKLEKDQQLTVKTVLAMQAVSMAVAFPAMSLPVYEISAPAPLPTPLPPLVQVPRTFSTVTSVSDTGYPDRFVSKPTYPFLHYS